MRLRSARQQAMALFVGAGVLAALLRWFPPTRYHFYPPCPFHSLFGIQCPGCGATRALAALLAGQWEEAAHLNLFFVLLTPLLCALAVAQIYSSLRWNRWRPLPSSRPAIWCVLTIGLLFGFARNMHWWFQGFR